MGSKSASFDIACVDMFNVAATLEKNPAYTGRPVKANYTLKYRDKVLKEGTDYVVTCSSNIKVGYAKATISGRGNFTGTTEKYFQVVRANIEDATIAEIPDKKFTGSAVKPKLNVKANGALLVEGTDYSVAYENNVNPGTASVTVYGQGNYQGVKKAAFDIARESMSAVKVERLGAQRFTGKAVKPKPKVTFKGRALVEGADYTLSYKNNVNAGIATVAVKGKGGLSGSKSATFKIAKASIKNSTLTVTPYSSTYTGKEITPKTTVKLGLATLKKGMDYSVAYKNNKKAGTATVKVSGKGNYTGAKATTFVINKANIGNASVSGLKKATYSGSVVKVEPTVKLNGVKLVKGVDYTLSYANNKNAGTAKVVVESKGSFFGTKTATFTIAKASIAKAKVSKIGAKKQTGKEITPKPTVTLGGKKLKLNTDYTLSYKNNKRIGTATVKVTGKGNYSGTVSTTFKIKK